MCMLCPPWLSFILYNPLRKAFTDRRRVLDECNIKADSVVVEIGAGNGFFTEEIAGHAKKVYAVELQQGMVRKLAKRINRFGDKVEILLQDIAASGIGEEMADVCLLYYSFHEVRQQEEAAVRIAGLLKHGGTLGIYEPSVEVPKAVMEKTVGLFVSQGFTVQHSKNNIFTRSAILRRR